MITRDQPMTDIEFYTAIQCCYGKKPKEQNCGRCPLLRSEIACDIKLRYEIQRRLTEAKRNAKNGYQQLSMI